MSNKKINLAETLATYQDTKTPELIRKVNSSFSKEARLTLVHRAYTGDAEAMDAIGHFSASILHDYIRALQSVIYSALWDVRCNDMQQAKQTLKGALIAIQQPEPEPAPAEENQPAQTIPMGVLGMTESTGTDAGEGLTEPLKKKSRVVLQRACAVTKPISDASVLPAVNDNIITLLPPGIDDDIIT